MFARHTLKKIETPKFIMSPIELKDYIPFEVKRVYFISRPTAPTGAHCHKEEQEFFFLAQGSATAVIDSGNGLEEIKMQAPTDALYVPAYVWHHFKDLSPDAILVALSSTNYRADRSDYIENYEAFLAARTNIDRAAKPTLMTDGQTHADGRMQPVPKSEATSGYAPTITMPRFLILGKGFLGTRLGELLPGSVVIEPRIEDKEAVLKAIDEYKPDAVINAAGETGRPNTDWCETHQIETYISNTLGPLVIAEACSARNIPLVHLSTGDMFHGEAPDSQGWTEDDLPSPFSYYERSKYAADLLLAKMPHVAIVRLRLPVDSVPSPRNLIDKLSTYKSVIDVTNSVTVVEDLADVIKQIVQKHGRGIFHVTNPGGLSYRKFLELYRENVDTSHQCEWITGEDLVKRGLAAKRAVNILQSKRLAEIGIVMRPIDQAIRDVIKKYAALKRPSIQPPITAPIGGQAQQNPTGFPHFLKSKLRETKGIILAGGSSTDQTPLTQITDRHLLMVHDKPIILYSLNTLIEAGIRQIILITGPQFAHQFVQLLGSGSRFGCNISYRIQEQSGGIAQAVGLAENFVGENNCVVHLGDNIFEDTFLPAISSFQSGAMIFYKHAQNAQQHGVVEIDPWGNVISIEEKPEHPKSSFAQLGLYAYDPEVFDIIKSLKPSIRGQLEITDVNNTYLAQHRLIARPVRGEWFDTGAHQEIKCATEYFEKKNHNK